MNPALNKSAHPRRKNMTPAKPVPPSPVRPFLGFFAGFLATLVFHQLILALLWTLGLAPFGPFIMTPVGPFGIPAVFSLAFWGGVWGIVYALFDHRFPTGFAYWFYAFFFGAIFPTLVALLVALPLKGQPLGGGWNRNLLITAVLINGGWGLGTGLFLRLMQPKSLTGR